MADQQQDTANGPQKPPGLEALIAGMRDGTRDEAIDAELQRSMETYGWLKQLPAIVAPDGTVVVGNRRMAMAEKLGIEPVVVSLDAGTDAVALAIASNIGSRPLTTDERRRIVRVLYQQKTEDGNRWLWTSSSIADVFGVSGGAVSQDIVATGPRRGGGQTLTPQGQGEILRLADDGLSLKRIGERVGVHHTTVSQVLDREFRRLSALPTENQQIRVPLTSPQPAQPVQPVQPVQPSAAYLKAKQDEADRKAKISEADRKAGEAEADELVAPIRRAFASLRSPYSHLHDAIRELEAIHDAGGIIDTDPIIELYIKFGRLLWEYGAVKGFDVSAVARMIELFDPPAEDES